MLLVNSHFALLSVGVSRSPACLSIHPFENRNVRKAVARLAREFKVNYCVHVPDTRSEDILTRHGAGIITISSTVGPLALDHGIPLLVLRDALYPHPALVSRYSCGFFSASQTRQQNYALPEHDRLDFWHRIVIKRLLPVIDLTTMEGCFGGIPNPGGFHGFKLPVRAARY